MAGKHKKAPEQAAEARSALQQRQDHAAELLRLQEALREAQLRGDELQAHCDTLERARGEALAAASEADARAQACRDETETLRRQFDARIAELRTLLEMLRPQTDVALRGDDDRT